MINLNTSLLDVRGVGPKTGEALAAAGLRTVRDMIEFLPRTYEDYEGVEAIANIKPGKVTIRARAENVSNRYTRRNLVITTATLVDNNDDKVQATWFNQPYRKQQDRARDGTLPPRHAEAREAFLREVDSLNVRNCDDPEENPRQQRSGESPRPELRHGDGYVDAVARAHSRGGEIADYAAD